MQQINVHLHNIECGRRQDTTGTIYTGKLVYKESEYQDCLSGSNRNIYMLTVPITNTIETALLQRLKAKLKLDVIFYKKVSLTSIVISVENDLTYMQLSLQRKCLVWRSIPIRDDTNISGKVSFNFTVQYIKCNNHIHVYNTYITDAYVCSGSLRFEGDPVFPDYLLPDKGEEGPSMKDIDQYMTDYSMVS